jgi:outer membrane autotransporter protein
LNGFDYNTGGVAVGGDYEVNENLVVGAGFGYADTNIDLDGGFGSGDIDSFMSSIYGTYYIDRAYLEGVFTYGDHSYDNTRKISIGDIHDSAESNHDADAFTGLVEGGYNFAVYDMNMQPYASLLYAYLHEEAFQETGAGSLDMHMGSTQTNDWASELGLRVSQDFKLFSGILTPELKAAWQYDFNVDRHTMPISFTGSSLGLTVDGRKQPSSALLGAGLKYTADSGISASVQYDGQIGEDFSATGVFGQVKVPF